MLRIAPLILCTQVSSANRRIMATDYIILPLASSYQTDKNFEIQDGHSSIEMFITIQRKGNSFSQEMPDVKKKKRFFVCTRPRSSLQNKANATTLYSILQWKMQSVVLLSLPTTKILIMFWDLRLQAKLGILPKARYSHAAKASINCNKLFLRTLSV